MIFVYMMAGVLICVFLCGLDEYVKRYKRKTVKDAIEEPVISFVETFKKDRNRFLVERDSVSVRCSEQYTCTDLVTDEKFVFSIYRDDHSTLLAVEEPCYLNLREMEYIQKSLVDPYFERRKKIFLEKSKRKHNRKRKEHIKEYCK